MAIAARGMGHHDKQRLRLLVRCGAGVILAGCGPARHLLYDPQTPIPPAPDTFDDRDWATVLRENVKDGLVDYEHLSSHTQPLDRFLDRVAAAGPHSTPALFPTVDSRVAYYINAYNAAVLKAVLVAERPPTLHDVRRGSLERVNRLRADRREQTLADLRESLGVESGGDARIELCLCDAALGSPPLFPEPFRAAVLREQLRRVAREAMDCPRMVAIDHQRQRLNLALSIYRNAGSFIDLYRRQTGTGSGTILASLLHLADGPRREWLNTAVGYPVSQIPFDRRLNLWRPASAGLQDGR